MHLACLLRRPLRLSSHAIAAGLLMTGAQAALAANVDLTSTITVPTNTSTVAPFSVTVRYGNAQSGTAIPATNATISISLPANLYGVSVASVSPGGHAATQCPAAAALTPIPVGTTTASTPAITGTIPSLPPGGYCDVTLQVTALVAGSYRYVSTITAGAADTETNLATNSTSGNSTIARQAVTLGVTKTIVSGATPNGTTTTGIPIYDAQWGQPVVYKLSYTNQSTVDLPLQAVRALWNDSESLISTTRPASVSSTLGGAGMASCVTSGASASVCPVLTANTATAFPSTGTSMAPLTMDMTNAILGKGATVDIYYTRVYNESICGPATIQNQARWDLGSNNTAITATFSPANSGTGSIQIHLPQVKACTEVNINPTLSKTLDSVTKADGTQQVKSKVGNNWIIQDDGDQANFTITLTGDATETVSFRLSDTLRNIAGGGLLPTFLPKTPGGADPVTYSVTLGSCTATGTGTACPTSGSWTGPYPKTLTANISTASAYSIPNDGGTLTIGPGGSLVFKVLVKYSIVHPAADPTNPDAQVLCRARVDNLLNQVQADVLQNALAAGKVFAGTTSLTRSTSATPLQLLTDTTPRCVDLAANKTVSNASPQVNEQFSFVLDYTNATSSATGIPFTTANANTASTLEVNPIKNLVVTDVLGSHFVPTAASCAVQTGTATAPAVSLANITGADNTFSAVIPSMSDQSTVRCTITGSSSLPGSFNNVTRIDLPASVKNSTLAEAVGTNNISDLNYGIIGPQVRLEKVALATPPFTPGGPLSYEVRVASANATAHANGTVVTDNMPAELQGATWTCVATGGAVCPTANGTGAINQTIATFPAGSMVTYTITGTADATATSITNTAQAMPPANGGCVDASGTPSAAPCTASATAGAGATAPHVSVTELVSPTTAVAPGAPVTFTITAKAIGAHAADGALVASALPTGLENATWTCTALDGAVCPATSGAGPLNETIATFPAGSSLIYTITGTAAANATTIASNVTITPPAGVTGASCDPCAANASVTVTSTPGNVAAVPVDSPWMLFSLMALMLGLAGGMTRLQQRRR